MPERAHAKIRQVLREVPDTEVRYIDALTVDTYFLKEDLGTRVLFVNPVHRELVESIKGP